MKRVVILGGSGFFGALIAERLRAGGVQPVIASRSHGDVRIDADNADSLKANLKARDLVIDAAGPFHKRTPALIQAARTIGFDVIDISDSVQYTSMIYENEAPIGASGVRVLTACSALSSVSAAILKSVGVTEPRRLSAYLVPPSRTAATPASTASLLHSLDGKTRSFRFPQPIGKRAGVTVKSVDSVTLRREFPTLRTIELVVDTHTFGMNAVLMLAARWQPVRRVLERYQPTAVDIMRRFGPADGVLAYEIGSSMKPKYVIFVGPKIYMLSVLPAIEAAQAILANKFEHRGVVPPSKHVDAGQLFETVRKEGIVAMAG